MAAATAAVWFCAAGAWAVLVVVGFTGGVPTAVGALMGGPNLDVALDVEELEGLLSAIDGVSVLGARAGVGREDDAGSCDVVSWYEG